ncbi:MAG: ABC transporter permease [Egibacteraceae bacterium]
MTHLLRCELIKLRTTRTVLAFAAAAVVLLLASTVLSITLGEVEDAAGQRTALAGAGTVAILLLLFGVVGAAGEYRHGTIIPALLIAPDRVKVTIAKLLAYGATGLAVGVVAQAGAFAIGVPLLNGTDEGRLLSTSDLVEIAVGGVLCAGLAAMIGVGVGALMRKQTMAVIAALVWFFVIEQVLTAVSGDIAGYGLNGSLGALAGAAADNALPWGTAGLVAAAWAIALCGAAVAVDSARDID